MELGRRARNLLAFCASDRLHNLLDRGTLAVTLLRILLIEDVHDLCMEDFLNCGIKAQISDGCKMLQSVSRTSLVYSILKVRHQSLNGAANGTICAMLSRT